MRYPNHHNFYKIYFHFDCCKFVVGEIDLPTYLPITWLWSWPWITIRAKVPPIHQTILPTSLLHKRRGVQLRFSRGPNLDKRLRFYRSYRFSCGVLLCSMKGMPESFEVGVPSGQFSPSMWRVLYLARHPLFLLDTTMERNFSWWYHWISSVGEDFNMPFSVSNFSVKFMSAVKHRAKT